VLCHQASSAARLHRTTAKQS